MVYRVGSAFVVLIVLLGCRSPGKRVSYEKAVLEAKKSCEAKGLVLDMTDFNPRAADQPPCIPKVELE